MGTTGNELQTHFEHFMRNAKPHCTPPVSLRYTYVKVLTKSLGHSQKHKKYPSWAINIFIDFFDMLTPNGRELPSYLRTKKAGPCIPHRLAKGDNIRRLTFRPHQFFKHLIGRGNNLGRGRVRTLGHNHIGELRRKIHV